MTTKHFVLMTVTCAQPEPSLEEAAAALGVELEALDAGFGVVVIDPARKLFSVQALEDAVARKAEGGAYRGPFSNPKIETFGPAKKKP